MSRPSKQSSTERHLRKILGLTEQKGGATYIEMDDDSQSEKKKEMKIFCVDLSSFSSTVQFVILCAATFFFYLIYGYLQVHLNY